MEETLETVKILIVEDEGIVALSIANDLERLGYVVTGICDSGEKALESIGTVPPGLVLMDIKLAGVLDGIETAGIVSAMHDLPVIFLTAHSEEGMLSRAGESDPYGYIVKPFDTRDLQIGIKMALYKHQADRKRKQLTEELRKSLESVKLLTGLLPICMHCKKIRNDKGYWQAIEHYISQHSEVEFSHGVCDDCMKQQYPDYPHD